MQHAHKPRRVPPVVLVLCLGKQVPIKARHMQTRPPRRPQRAAELIAQIHVPPLAVAALALGSGSVINVAAVTGGGMPPGRLGWMRLWRPPCRNVRGSKQLSPPANRDAGGAAVR